MTVNARPNGPTERPIFDALYTLMDIGTPGNVVRSQKGAPYLRVSPSITVAYFGKGKFYRVFSPRNQDWPDKFNDGQNRQDYKDPVQVRDFIDGLLDGQGYD